MLIYRVRGDGFLHHMVRNLVGTFVDVGRGQTGAGGDCAHSRGAFAEARPERRRRHEGCFWTASNTEERVQEAEHELSGLADGRALNPLNATLKAPMASAAPATASIARIAADRRVHQAFQWLHLQEQRIMQWQAEMVAVPAPPFGERARAEWLCERFRELGLENPHIDEVGNAIGTWPGKGRVRGALCSRRISTRFFPRGRRLKPTCRGRACPLRAPATTARAWQRCWRWRLRCGKRAWRRSASCVRRQCRAKKEKATCAACGISIGTRARRAERHRGAHRARRRGA